VRAHRILSRTTVAVLVAVGLLAAGGPASAGAARAADYPVSTFAFLDPDQTGDSAGSITWYNRSVGIQGHVYDRVPDGKNVTVYFDFFQGNVWLGIQTRSAPDAGDLRSFNFTQNGPQGGITLIIIRVCAHSCSFEYRRVRPTS
jgi:hypothetical protein